MNEIHAFGKNMKSILFLLPAILLFPLLGFSESLEPSEDRRKVEFFEKLYDTKIMGIKLIGEYDDPDTFYSEIAKQVGIPGIVYEAVEKKLGWKNDDENFLMLMIKGGGNNDAWGVMITKVPSALNALNGNIEDAKTKEEKKKLIAERIDLLKKMEMKMVVVGYDGDVSFHEFKDEKKTFYENGNPKEKGSTNDKGQRIGEWTRYHQNGNKRVTINYTKGKLNGDLLVFSENGNLICKEPWVLGKKVGDVITYHFDGQIKSVQPFKNGNLHGVLINYWPNGQIKSKQIFKQGKAQRPLEVFDDSGN